MDDPFEQLTRSHRRLEERLRDLLDAARDDGLDEIGAREVMEFLGRQVKRHEEDEEGSLFPRVANRADLTAVIAGLRAEHASQAALHDELARALGDKPVRPHEVRRIAIALEEAYRRHIDVEEAVLFPAARRALSAEDLAAIFDEMQARRGRGGLRSDRR